MIQVLHLLHNHDIVVAVDAHDSGPAPPGWLLLIHQMPAKPAYARVKLWRRLQGIGAVAVKHAVYALPAGGQTLEDFAWLLKELVDAGGEGLLCEARLIDGLADAEVRALFNAARAADYAALAEDVRMLAAADVAQIRRLRARAAQIAAIDFFGADGREAVEGLLDAMEGSVMPQASREPATPGIGELTGRVWATRQGVQVDRIASAWLIRRCIDPAARFRFVHANDDRPLAGELRFDMFAGNFTHEGDRCTFETLLLRLGLTDPALAAIAEIVHDIDLKDEKFGRAEAAGIAQLIRGIAAGSKNDEQRLARGAAVFDALYESFSGNRPRPGS